MSHLSASVLFVQETGLHEAPRMLGDSFKVAADRLGDILQRQAVLPHEQKQNLKPAVISGPLKISFQLPRCFRIFSLVC